MKIKPKTKEKKFEEGKSNEKDKGNWKNKDEHMRNIKEKLKIFFLSLNIFLFLKGPCFSWKFLILKLIIFRKIL